MCKIIGEFGSSIIQNTNLERSPSVCGSAYLCRRVSLRMSNVTT
jgi:hypothetical protein